MDVPSTAVPYGGNQFLEDLFLLKRLDVESFVCSITITKGEWLPNEPPCFSVEDTLLYKRRAMLSSGEDALLYERRNIDQLQQETLLIDMQAQQVAQSLIMPCIATNSCGMQYPPGKRSIFRFGSLDAASPFLSTNALTEYLTIFDKLPAKGAKVGIASK